MTLMESWRFGRNLGVANAKLSIGTTMSLKLKLGILAAGLMLSGCMQATTYEATNQSNFKPRDKELLAKIRYTNTPVAEPYRRTSATWSPPGRRKWGKWDSKNTGPS